MLLIRNRLEILLSSCLLLCAEIVQTKAISSASAGASSVQTDLELINGTLNYRIYGKKGHEKPWRGLDMPECVRRGRCEKLKNLKICLGTTMPYDYTSFELSDYQSQEQVLERLKNYEALRYVPKCWAVVQPFLCAVFAPKCEQINGHDMVYLPSLEMCRITLEPCRILFNTTFFPEFLRCNETLFPSKCNNVVRELKFNVTGSCLPPLVAAESSASYYPGIEGCGVQCKDPLYTDDEHRQIQKLIGWCGTLCCLSNLFVVVTFLIDWENANKYPALIVFYINLCFLIATLGWLIQFTPGSRDDIVCRKDGTLRHSEPTAGENLSCIVIFVLVYYFLVAAMVWFVFLTYAWHLRAVGNVQDRIDKKGSYFHLVAWSLPLVLTITTMALSEVDGNSIVGICFVGYLNHPIRSGLLLGPLCGVILVGGYFIIRGMVMLFGLKHFANDIKSTSASNKIHLIIVRMGLCALFTLIFILVAIACHVTEFRHSLEWVESLRKSIICRISSTYTDEHFATTKCKLESRPSVAILQLHLLCLFGSGIVMSTWCWTPSSIETWKRKIRKKFGYEVAEDVKMPKHKVIAQTWAKRKEFEDKGRLSITLYNTHTDPVGLNFDVNDLNSSETNEISSTWANYLPQFVKRRMALTGAGTTNSSSQGPRKSSLDSEISFSVRHVSVESRRNSVDSQVSVKIAEMKTKVASRTRNRHHHHHHHQQQSSKHAATNSSTKRSQRRRDFIAASAATTGRRFSGRRESSTSIESQVIALQKTTYPNVSHKVGVFAASAAGQNHAKKHNSKRRTANACLDAADISAFFANSELILPFLRNQELTTSSDEDEDVDEQSRASYKVHDSRLDVVLKQDSTAAQQNGPHIEEICDDDIECNSKTQAKKQAALENLLKNMQKSNESCGGGASAAAMHRHSRNSTRSRQSRKSNTANASVSTATAFLNGGGNNGRRSQRNRTQTTSSGKQKTSPKTAKSPNDAFKSSVDDIDADEIGASNSSYTSADLDIPLSVMLNSSYSGVSNGKPNSRNSKTSCDVGIQTNAYEIATQTLSSFGDNELKEAMRHLNAKHSRKSHAESDEYATEMHSLLGGNRTEPMLVSESDRLKMLLLPSK